MKKGHISFEDLKLLTTNILKSFGYPSDRAEITARVLVEADARGVSSHGVARLKFYENNLAGGFAVPDADPEVVHETPLSVVVDGHRGIGSHIAKTTMERCIEKAQTSGAGFGSVRNSNHYGMAGLWAEMAAKKGLLGIALTNTRKCAIPTFGRERLLGTNPIAVAFPTDGPAPFLLDMATTTVAHGKIEVCHRRNKKMPSGWVVDETGRGTTDPHAAMELFAHDASRGGHLFLGGEGELLGGHKGYGLGMLVEILSSGLSLGSWSFNTFMEGEGSGITHFLAAISLNLFGNEAEIRKHVSSLLETIRTSNKAEGHDRIYIHGEKEAEKRRETMAEGILLDEATLHLLNAYAEKFGLATPPFSSQPE